MRVLVIEDDAETARYVGRAPREAGHEAASQDNGRDGLRVALSERWDVFIVDRMLPQIDGLEVVESLRRGGSLASILILTTLGGVDDGVGAGAWGGWGVWAEGCVFIGSLASPWRPLRPGCPPWPVEPGARARLLR